MKRTVKKYGKEITVITVIAAVLIGCGADYASAPDYGNIAANSNRNVLTVYVEDEAVALSDSPVTQSEAAALAGSAAAQVNAGKVEASGALTAGNSEAVIDYSNTADGYVMVKYKKSTDKKLKVQVKGPNTTYTYNLTAGKWEVFPLTDGNGTYQIVLLKNISGTKYSIVQSRSCKVELKDEFAPYIRTNQYVNYAEAPKTTAKAASLTKKKKTELAKVQAIYNYVVKNITYDKKKAQNVQTGYLPDLDAVLESKKGICFDYAALMAGMLRSQGIPCKLVIGYAGTTYHAWISVWVDGQGWVDGVIYFDGTAWKRMDPTFASSSKQSASIMKYISNGKNYTAKYFY